MTDDPKKIDLNREILDLDGIDTQGYLLQAQRALDEFLVSQGETNRVLFLDRPVQTLQILRNYIRENIPNVNWCVYTISHGTETLIDPGVDAFHRIGLFIVTDTEGDSIKRISMMKEIPKRIIITGNKGVARMLRE
ncbi:MAG: hypothetical protein UT34_C0001G0271 [candidate division WS6 bacterium GW2011_GWF2_39_15]|uniref:Uncharacterized protein n=1 Tax=candidate division WS6 bacterium GW2011_GWF2_39_15 TaxID=1619100 RepID=A0A0G0N086_9BACT|nr:MAG: hypothetical protein UT34_C0001G0271 [candidate division WS6 bacterium GW2011_GWF2_39_15]